MRLASCGRADCSYAKDNESQAANAAPVDRGIDRGRERVKPSGTRFEARSGSPGIHARPLLVHFPRVARSCEALRMNDCFQPTRLRRARPSIGNTVWGNPIVEWHRIALVLQYSAEMSAHISQLCRFADAADFFQPLREPDLFLGAYEGQRFDPERFSKRYALPIYPSSIGLRSMLRSPR
jgi:hypothetical protein